MTHYSAALRLRGKVLAVETAGDEAHAQSLAADMLKDTEVVVLEGKLRVSGFGKYVIQINADELRNGKPFKKCPHCAILKDLNDFGLRRKSGAAKHGFDVITTQAWCSACRAHSPTDTDSVA